jgi:hypothetical protein
MLRLGAGSETQRGGRWRSYFLAAAFREITPDKSLAPYRDCLGWEGTGMVKRAGRGSFDGGDLKEVADSIRYRATIDSLCNGLLAGWLMALREGNSARQWAVTRPEDNMAQQPWP